MANALSEIKKTPEKTDPTENVRDLMEVLIKKLTDEDSTPQSPNSKGGEGPSAEEIEKQNQLLQKVDKNGIVEGKIFNKIQNMTVIFCHGFLTFVW